MSVAQGNSDEAQAALLQAQAQQTQATLREVEADAMATESQAKFGQALHTIDTVDTLMSERPRQSLKGGERPSRPRALPRGRPHSTLTLPT